MVVSDGMGKLIEFKRKEPGVIQRTPGLCEQGLGSDLFELLSVHQIPRGPSANLRDQEPIIGINISPEIIPKLDSGIGSLSRPERHLDPKRP
jgi:hypothetical protein